MSEQSLHYKLLYRWVGRGNEMAKSGADQPKTERLKPFSLRPLSSSQRDWYFDRICEALDPKKGLLATLPTETLGGLESGFKAEMPSLSLTQLSLTNAEAHCRRYGRLGFGFTKRAILHLGGRPIAYIPGGKTDPTVRRLLKLREWLSRSQAAPRLLLDFDYLRHFYKRIQFPCPQRDPSKLTGRKEKVAKAPAQPADPLKQMAYPTPSPLAYAEEQEWRIVLPTLERFTPHDKIKHARWFPVEAGNELQVLVVPDNVIYQRVLSDKQLRKAIAPPHRKPVQVISWESLKRI